jgi:hypothetical protein
MYLYCIKSVFIVHNVVSIKKTTIKVIVVSIKIYNYDITEILLKVALSTIITPQ